MKQVKAIFSVLMLSVLILSTVGFSVNRHYCLGMLKAESFYLPAEKCAGEDEHTRHDENSFSRDCCSDEFVSIPGLQVQSQVKNTSANQAHTAVLAKPILPPLKAKIATASTYLLPLSNAPPEYGKQLLVRVQRFLI